MMQIRRLDRDEVEQVAPLTALFRVALKGYKGIAALPDVAAGYEELMEYLDAGWPVYKAMMRERCVGYLVCRVEAPCVWVESIFVQEAYRRRRIATLLLREAEALAKSYGEETLYFNVHPNNRGMIAFLRRHGYTVLNLIEIRKPYAGENPSAVIRVGENDFDY